MKKYFSGITERMLSEIITISALMTHQGEKGRNNEFVLAKFLKKHLPERYSITTGKVVSSNGEESSQTDIIIFDHLNASEFVTGDAWSLVPVENVRMVISVKTTLDRGELSSAVDQIRSVRQLQQDAAVEYERGVKKVVPPGRRLCPLGMIFAYQSSWVENHTIQDVFGELITPVHDDYRPNALCIINRCTLIRRPYTTDTMLLSDHPLLHFFVFCNKALATFPEKIADLEKYFQEYPG